MYKVIIPEYAKNDLARIKDYIFRFTFSQELATNTINKIIANLLSLKIFPKMYPVFRGDLRVMTVDKKYRAFYKIFEEEKKVVVYYIFNSGEDYGSLIH